MEGNINWNPTDYKSRLDHLADDLSTFIASVLETIDEQQARSSQTKWTIVCSFFAGCAKAARVQGASPQAGGRRMAAELAAAFPCHSEASTEGFDEFMDWLSQPETFQPTRLQLMIASR